MISSHLTADLTDMITSAVSRYGSQNQSQKYLEWRRLSKTKHSACVSCSKGVKTGAGSLAYNGWALFGCCHCRLFVLLPSLSLSLLLSLSVYELTWGESTSWSIKKLPQCVFISSHSFVPQTMIITGFLSILFRSPSFLFSFLPS